MSVDLILKQSCDGCGSTVELYGSTCRHLTLCLNCGKSMAEKRSSCCECGTSITRLIREYNVRASPNSDTDYVVGTFAMGLPNFKKNQNRWSLQTGLRGRQVTDALQKKYKNKPWLLEHEADQLQYEGQFQGLPMDIYYLLLLQKEEFVAIPVDSWCNFKKVVQYKQVTLDEAEKRMKNRISMMKARYQRVAAFREGEKFDGQEGAARGNDVEANVPDWGEEDEDKEVAPKCRIGLKRQSGDDDEECPGCGEPYFDDDKECPGCGDLYFDDGDDMEKGDDWDHEEIFSSDDEKADLEEEDLVTKIPAYPEVKQDAEEEFETDEEYAGLSESGKALMKLIDAKDEYEEYAGLNESGRELKKLLDRLNNLDSEEDGDDEDDDEDEHETDEEEAGLSKSGKEMKKLDDDNDDMVHDTYLVLVKEVLKKELVDKSSPLNPTTSAAGRGTPSTSKSLKGKKNGEESKTPNGEPLKKVKTEYVRSEVKSLKDETASSIEGSGPIIGATPPASSKGWGSTTYWNSYLR